MMMQNLISGNEVLTRTLRRRNIQKEFTDPISTITDTSPVEAFDKILQSLRSTSSTNVLVAQESMSALTRLTKDSSKCNAILKKDMRPVIEVLRLALEEMQELLQQKKNVGAFKLTRQGALTPGIDPGRSPTQRQGKTFAKNPTKNKLPNLFELILTTLKGLSNLTKSCQWPGLLRLSALGPHFYCLRLMENLCRDLRALPGLTAKQNVESIRKKKKKDRVREIVKECCILVSNFAVLPSLGQDMIDHGVIGLILKAYVVYSDVTVQTAAISACWSLCLTSKDCNKLFWRLGFFKEILRAMDNHVSSSKLQEVSCGALFCCGELYSLIRLNAYDRVKAAMTNHKNNPKLVYLSICTIHNLCSIPNNCELLLGVNVDKLVISAMLHHASNQKIQHRGCIALWHLSSVTLFKTRVISDLERTSRRQPMKKKTTFANLQTQIFKKPKASKTTSDQLFDVIVEILKDREISNYASTVASAMAVLSNLATEEKIALHLRKKKIESVIVKVGNTHIEIPETVDSILTFLRNLFFWNKEKPVKLSPVPKFLLDVGRKYRKDTVIQGKVKEIKLSIGSQ